MIRRKKRKKIVLKYVVVKVLASRNSQERLERSLKCKKKLRKAKNIAYELGFAGGIDAGIKREKKKFERRLQASY